MAARVYLDYAAATPLDPRVEAAMQPYLAGRFANPGSAHWDGQQAAAVVEVARRKVADFLGAAPDEVLFTSGATESCNLAVLGSVRRALRQHTSVHVVTTVVEHPAVAEPVRQLVAEGATATTVGASRQTFVSVKDVLGAVRDDTVLVAVAYVCSETGSAQPIAELGRALARLNAQRLAIGLGRVLLFTDATQAAPWWPCQVEDLGVDMLALSGHKIYGPKGVGALFSSRATELEPLLYGGSQEGHRRPGTVNVPAVVGLGAAVRLLRGPRHLAEVRRVTQLRDQLATALARAGACRLTVASGQVAPGHLHVSLSGISSETMLTALDLVGISASAGWACQAGAHTLSPVLLGSGWSAAQARTAIRFSLGRTTTAQDVRLCVRAWRAAAARLKTARAAESRLSSARSASRRHRRSSRDRG